MIQICKISDRNFLPNSRKFSCHRLNRRLFGRKHKNGKIFCNLDLSLDDKVVIVGAGIAGLASAVALKQVGIPFCVLESSDKLSEGGTAIGLWTNAFRALEELQVVDQIRDLYPQLKKFQVAREDGRVLKQSELPLCDHRRHEFRGVKRSALLQILKDQISQQQVIFDCTVEKIKQNNTKDGATIVLQDGSEFQCKAVVGADGVRSKVAASLGIPPPNFNGQYAIRGLVEVQDDCPIDLDKIYTWWGEGVRVGAYLVGQNYMYWFVCFNGPAAKKITDPKQIKNEALKAIQGWKVPIHDLFKNTPDESLSRSSLGDRWIFPYSTVGMGNITLAGDALHPMTPNFGQGGCTALEDAVTLSKFLQQAWKDGKIEDGLRKYERVRTARCSPITVRSYALGFISQSELIPVVARDVLAQLAPSKLVFDHAIYDVSKQQI